MKIACSVVLAVALLVFGLGTTLVFADQMVVNVQFPFKAVGTDFPSGTYRIETSNTEEIHAITIRNLATGEAKIVPFLTRLSERETPAVVFDKVGDQYYLSEIYMTGLDGFYIKAAPGTHTHVKVPQAEP
ncbi:MAG TPA: hypothetical protein VE398_24510 [Acidobacteriota bacterium]|nr:hypothetical protein [Acidobacteriota bacterium]